MCPIADEAENGIDADSSPVSRTASAKNHEKPAGLCDGQGIATFCMPDNEAIW